MAAHGSFYGNIDYVLEAIYGTTPATPTMVWIGRVYNAKPTNRTKVASKRYLTPVAITDNRMLAYTHVKVGEEIGLQVDFIPQTGSMYNWIQYFLGAAGGPSDTLPSMSISLIDNNAATNKYMLFKGLVGQELVLDALEDSPIDIKSRLIGNELTLGAADVAGITHPAASAGAELRTADITSAQIGYTGAYANITDALNGLSVRISNNLQVVTDLNNTTSTKAIAIIPKSREIVLTLDLDYTDLGTALTTHLSITDVRGLKEYQFKFTLDGKTYSFTGLKFPDLGYAFGPDDLIGDKVTSLTCTGMTVA